MGSNNLTTWDHRNREPDFHLEWQFLRQCESNCYTDISGKRRFIEFLRLLHLIPEKPARILDVGGNLATARWLAAKFPSSQITALNNCEHELGNWPYAIKANAMDFNLKEKYDLVFLGEVLEHVYNPDGVIACSALSMNQDGFMVVTTPNLSCIYNRIFLLFGWSLGNYCASLRYRTGNPLYRDPIGDFKIVGDHKSVFTYRGLVELLKLYGLIALSFRGYDYGQFEEHKTSGGQYVKLPAGKLRTILNNYIPSKLREGMLFLCKLSGIPDVHKITGGILKGRLWD